ncbi:hypothetical protein GJ688_11725 [Heliobacillus mobilis]|uniref:Glycosyl hydrolases family 43 n=1 Tax=Heliobacterium mobile TaxID=28064 RepID=A0A6I3SL60_HELMO|nr:hypothetical protein [Heliobacterium mobile]
MPRRKNVYSSFPTFVEHKGKLYIYYRQGTKDKRQCHGMDGVVREIILEKEEFFHQLKDRSLRLTSGNSFSRWISKTRRRVKAYRDSDESWESCGTVVFSSENELDAIVSRLDENRFSLCTRTYIPGKAIAPTVSFAAEPDFDDRWPVTIPSIDWFVFYGKSFTSSRGYVFPAYGQRKGEPVIRPFLLVTDDGHHWDLLATITDYPREVILNESSIVFDGHSYYMFMRQDNGPFGIWVTESTDLLQWSPPKKLFSMAHAPMAIHQKGQILLAYRRLMTINQSAVGLAEFNPLSDLSTGKAKQTDFGEYGLTGRKLLDFYSGNPYDGGYADLAWVDEKLVTLYYLGNRDAEPAVRFSVLDPRELPSRQVLR